MQQQQTKQIGPSQVRRLQPAAVCDLDAEERRKDDEVRIGRGGSFDQFQVQHRSVPVVLDEKKKPRNG